MREARIILPLSDNNGVSLREVHARLENTLCLHFGGATVMPMRGIWRDPETGWMYAEEGLAYDVAMEPSPANDATLIDVARRIGADAGQLAMFVRTADGTVNIIDTREEVAA